MRNNEQGRSMIEMLGVLAIVGVLSVGGIAGYSKAMGKFKTNKLIDQINMIATNVRTLYASQPNYHGLTEALAKQVNLIPAEMYTAVDDGNITNAFGGPVHLVASQANSDEEANGEKAYILSVSGVPSTACVSIVTTDWGSDSDAGLVGMMAAVGEDDTAVKNRLAQEAETNRNNLAQAKLQLDKEKLIADTYSKAADRQVKREQIDAQVKIAKTNRNKYDK